MGRRGGESKIVYVEAGHIRAVRGVVVGDSEDGLFLIISRRAGEVRIAKNIILKIEEGG